MRIQKINPGLELVRLKCAWNCKIKVQIVISGNCFQGLICQVFGEGISLGCLQLCETTPNKSRTWSWKVLVAGAS
jgi:hypothetical protein